MVSWEAWSARPHTFLSDFSQVGAQLAFRLVLLFQATFVHVLCAGLQDTLGSTFSKERSG